jgi:hypothetical protein
LSSGLLFAGLVVVGGEELLAVAAAEQEDEAVQVVTGAGCRSRGCWTRPLAQLYRMVYLFSHSDLNYEA